MSQPDRDTLLIPFGLGGGSGAADLPQATIDLTVAIQDLFGGTVDLGTDGFCEMRWHRVGRMIEGFIYMYVNDDAVYPSGGPFHILGTDLPAVPRATPLNPAPFGGFFGEAGLFGFATDHPSTWFEPISTGTNDFGSGTPSFVFPLADGNGGGINSLWGSANPQALTAIEWSYRGKFSYEAADPA